MLHLTLKHDIRILWKAIWLLSFTLIATWLAGQTPPAGNALQFGGLTDYVQLGNVVLKDSGNPDGNWTIECWFKRSELNNFENLFHSNFLAIGANHGVRLEMNEGTGQWGGLGKLYVYGLGGPLRYIDTNSPYKDQWYHIALVADNTSSTVSWYLNGNKVSSRDIKGPSEFPKFVIGIGYSNGTERDFNGMIDEFRIWKTVRNSSDIKGDFTKKLTGNEPGLVRYFDFDQPGVNAGGDNSSVTKLIDKTGNGDGTIINFTLNGETSNFVNNGDAFEPDCSVPITLFSENSYTGDMAHFEKAGEHSFGNTQISKVQSVEVSPGWHVAISEDQGGKIQFEESMPETNEEVKPETNVLLARRLNTYEEENTCKGYVYLSVKSIIRNNILVSRIKMGEPEAKIIGTIPSHTKGLWVAAADMGDILTFSFAKEETDFKIPSIPVADYVNEIYELMPEMQWKDARTRYQRIANAAASRFTFDACYIPPAFIDKPMAQGGGMRGQIFNDLRESDTDWTAIDGDIALKNQFSLMVINEGSGSKTSKSVYSKQSFKESFSFNIGAEVSAPLPNAPAVQVTPSGSYGYKEETEENWEDNHVYTFSRISNKVYNVTLVPEKMDFTREFIQAVHGLPLPAEGNVVSLEAAKNDPAWAAYFDTFIKAWGTHYPTQVTYGGFFTGVAHESFESYAKRDFSSEDFTAGLKADASATIEMEPVPGGPKISKEVGASGSVSGGVSTEEEQTMQTSSGELSYSFLFRGGEGSSFDNYAVGDDVQPTDIMLKSLDNLFENAYFDEEIPDLELKKKFLSWAINEYVRINVGKGPQNIPLAEMYEMTVSEIVVNSCDGDGTGDEDVEFTGEVWASQGSVNAKLGDGNRIWNQSKQAFDCVDDCPKTFTLNNQKYMVYVTPDASGSMDRGDKGFQFKAKFEEDDSFSNDDLGEQQKKIQVSEIISTTPQDFNLQFNRDGFDITVKSKVRKIPLSELGIDVGSGSVKF